MSNGHADCRYSTLHCASRAHMLASVSKHAKWKPLLEYSLYIWYANATTRGAAHSANFDEKVHKPQSWCDCDWWGFPHLVSIWIILSMHYYFLVSEGLQGTHMNAINPFNSKLMTLTPRGGLWTFSAILALYAQQQTLTRRSAVVNTRANNNSFSTTRNA